MKNLREIEVKDMVGNQERGYRFQVMEIFYSFDGYVELLVQDISTFEKFKTTTDEMHLA